MTRIIALISTYKESELLRSCLNSARDCDFTIIFDGPTTVENANNQFDKSDSPYPGSRVRYYVGEWDSDASKRTQMLMLAKTAVFQAGWGTEEEIWGLWLDGDEILIWGQYLHDHCQRAEQETATGGTTIRIVEYDGSVAECYGKLIKLATVKRYIMSSYEVELENGLTVALPNVPICTAGGIPYVGNNPSITNPDDPRLAILRPPLQGEPHLLHRHGLRSKNREVPRMHDAESASFSTLVEDAGLEGVDKSTGFDPNTDCWKDNCKERAGYYKTVNGYEIRLCKHHGQILEERSEHGYSQALGNWPWEMTAEKKERIGNA